MVNVFVFSEAENYIVKYLTKVMEEHNQCFNFTHHDLPILSSVRVDNVWHKQFPHSIHETVETFQINETFLVPFSSRYALYIHGCRIRYGLASYRIDGEVAFKNPFGYLGYNEYMNMALSIFFLTLYFLVSLYWGFMLYKYPRNIHLYQKLLKITLILGFVASLVELIYWSIYNRSGKSPTTALAFYALLYTALQTFARGVFIFICSGFKIANRRLTRTEMAFKACTLALFFGVHVIYYSLESIRNLTHPYISLIYVTPALLVESLYMMTCYYTIVHAMRLLKVHRDSFKVNLFHSVKTILFVLFLWFLLLTYLNTRILTSPQWKLWPLLWIFETYWRLGYFGGILFLLYLFHPCSDNEKYSYVTYNVEPNEDVENVEPMEEEEQELFQSKKYI